VRSWTAAAQRRTPPEQWCHPRPRQCRRSSSSPRRPRSGRPWRTIRLVAVYHLVPREEYERQDTGTDYLPAAFGADGFIHLPHGADELAIVGNCYYRADLRPFLALVVDLARVRAPVRYE